MSRLLLLLQIFGSCFTGTLNLFSFGTQYYVCYCVTKIVYFSIDLKTKSLLATLLICLIINLTVGAQTADNDSINNDAKTDITAIAGIAADSLALPDTVSVSDSADSAKPKPKRSLLTTDVKTSAKDSTIFSLDG
jgi:hypothetical protein